jgi:hypothetical protein
VSRPPYDLTDANAREDALGRLGEMVVKVRDRVGGEQATVLGGLTRVALGEDSKVVNMAQGGGVKATWTVGG